MEHTTGACAPDYFGYDQAKFSDNGQEMTYNACGISGTTPVEMFNEVTVHVGFNVNGNITAMRATLI